MSHLMLQVEFIGGCCNLGNVRIKLCLELNNNLK